MAELWHYSDRGTPKGPVARAEIETMIRQGVISRTTLIWREGMTGWVDAWTQFSFDTITPPPLPGQYQEAPLAQPGPAQPGTAVQDGLYAGAPARSFQQAISICFGKYATFSGRASRSEYWYFVLFTVLVSFALALVEAVATGGETTVLSDMFSLATLLPSLAVGARRLHDIDRSGWWIGAPVLGGIAFFGFALAAAQGPAAPGLITIGSVIGLGLVILLLVFLVTKGDPGPNRFG